jgi:hypothetical protein
MRDTGALWWAVAVNVFSCFFAIIGSYLQMYALLKVERLGTLGAWEFVEHLNQHFKC